MFVNLFFGTLISRFGSKKLIVAGFFLGIGLSWTSTYACSGPIMNWVFDMCGSYKPVFIVCGLIMVALLLCFQYVIRASKQK